jgi:transposase/cell division protein FtsB
MKRIMSLASSPLPQDINDLRAFAASLQAGYATIANQNDQLANQNNQLADQNNQLADQNGKLADQNNELIEAQKTLQTEVKIYKDELYAKTLHIEKLKMQLAVLRRNRFGRSSEKLDSAIEQMEMLLGDLEEGQGEKAAPEPNKMPSSPSTPTRQRTQPVRKPLPEHLPRERVEHEAACTCPACGSTRMTKIGTDEREVLEYVPSHFKVIVHARPKMSCRDCEKITQEPMPSLPIPYGIPGPALLAHVLISRFDDHLPYYRQSEIYARENVDLDRSTLAAWVGQITHLLTPLAEAIAQHVRAGETTHIDDTTVPVLDPGSGKTKTGRLWAMVRDERPWGSTSPPAVFYHYSPNRKGEHAEAMVKGCKGYLHADAYSGFTALYEPNPATGKPDLIEVACWAHGRRKVYDVHEATLSPAALTILERISELFAIEDEIKGQPPSHRLRVRQERSVPKLNELKTFYDTTLNQISGKSPLAEAIRYTTSRWAAMMRYTIDGRLAMTNNAAERAERPVAIGRKNWMFAGSDDGGRRAATAYTLIETAKMNRVEPEAYLRAVVARIGDHHINKIDQLLPWNIKL